MIGLFVTGTDTEVGKTFVSAAVAASLAAEGHWIRALKPVASGGEAPGEDAVRLGEAAGHAPLCHTCLLEPAAPDRAARQADTVVDVAALVGWCAAHGAAGPVLVEGVGGWAVPLRGRQRVGDLASALGLPVLVVAANRLGVLSHTLLTVAAVHQAGLPVVGVVLSDAFDCHPELAAWNRDDLRAQLDVPVVALRRLIRSDERVAAGQHLRSRLRLDQHLVIPPPV